MYIFEKYLYFSSFEAGNSNDEKYSWNNSAGQGLTKMCAITLSVASCSGGCGTQSLTRIPMVLDPTAR